MIDLKDRIKSLIDKNVFLEISNKRYYNGVVKEVSDTHISMIDKYDELIIIALSEIKFIQEKKVNNTTFNLIKKS